MTGTTEEAIRTFQAQGGWAYNTPYTCGGGYASEDDAFSAAVESLHIAFDDYCLATAPQRTSIVA